MTDARAEVVCDAGPLIHLDELGCLDLLSDFAQVMIPVPVWREVGRHRPQIFSSPQAGFRQVKVETGDDPEFRSLVSLFQLDSGEQSALWLLRSHPDAVFLTDDAAARLASQSLDYRTHGTIGILIRAIRRGQRTQSEVLSLLNQIPLRSTLHIRSDLLSEIIGQVEGFPG